MKFQNVYITRVIYSVQVLEYFHELQVIRRKKSLYTIIASKDSMQNDD